MPEYNGTIVSSQLSYDKDKKPNMSKEMYNFFVDIEISGTTYLFSALGKSTIFRYPTGSKVKFDADFGKVLFQKDGNNVYRAKSFDFINDEEKAKFPKSSSDIPTPSTPPPPSPRSNTQLPNTQKSEPKFDVLSINDEKISYELALEFIKSKIDPFDVEAKLISMEDLQFVKDKIKGFLHDDSLNETSLPINAIRRIKRYVIMHGVNFVKSSKVISNHGINNSDDLINYLRNIYLDPNFNSEIIVRTETPKENPLI